MDLLHETEEVVISALVEVEVGTLEDTEFVEMKDLGDEVEEVVRETLVVPDVEEVIETLEDLPIVDLEMTNVEDLEMTTDVVQEMMIAVYTEMMIIVLLVMMVPWIGAVDLEELPEMMTTAVDHYLEVDLPGRERKSRDARMRLPREGEKKERPGKRLRGRRRPRRMPRGKLSWRSLKGRRGRRREKLRRSWPGKEKRRIVRHLAVGKVMELEVVKMMVLMEVVTLVEIEITRSEMKPQKASKETEMISMLKVTKMMKKKLHFVVQTSDTDQKNNNQ